jgi:hypothetical protein
MSNSADYSAVVFAFYLPAGRTAYATAPAGEFCTRLEHAAHGLEPCPNETDFIAAGLTDELRDLEDASWPELLRAIERGARPHVVWRIA